VPTFQERLAFGTADFNPSSLGRKNAEKLVTNYGGKLTKSLSKNTGLVVVGNDAGPTKLEKISELGLETVDEDAFVKLLEAGGGGAKRAADDDEKPAKMKKAKK
jgi:BRCT domain type II-containing protein